MLQDTAVYSGVFPGIMYVTVGAPSASLTTPGPKFVPVKTRASPPVVSAFVKDASASVRMAGAACETKCGAAVVKSAGSAKSGKPAGDVKRTRTARSAPTPSTVLQFMSVLPKSLASSSTAQSVAVYLEPSAPPYVTMGTARGADGFCWWKDLVKPKFLPVRSRVLPPAVGKAFAGPGAAAPSCTCTRVTVTSLMSVKFTRTSQKACRLVGSRTRMLAVSRWACSKSALEKASTTRLNRSRTASYFTPKMSRPELSFVLATATKESSPMVRFTWVRSSSDTLRAPTSSSVVSTRSGMENGCSPQTGASSTSCTSI